MTAEEKEKKNLYWREYRLKNVEKVREYEKKYRNRNKDKLAISGKKYRESHAEKIKENSKNYYSKNKEKRNKKAQENYIVKKEEYNNRSKKWKKENPERVNMLQREFCKNNPDKVLSCKLKHKYGITIDDYNRMFEEQNGCCATCKKHQSEFKVRLYVDHNHITGKVRGLLCNNCNVALGNAKEDLNTLRAMIEYLQKDKI